MWLALQIALARHNLGGLHSTHLADPRRSRLDLAHSAQLLARIAGNADVVGALKHELDVANLEHLASTLLGVLAGCVQDVVDEAVCKVKNGLVRRMLVTRETVGWRNNV